MSDEHKISQDELKKEVTKEDIYFQKLDEERLAAAKHRIKVRKMLCQRAEMPAGGCALEVVDIDGVKVDRCPTCQGVWLDAHELEELRQHHVTKKHGLLDKVLDVLMPGREVEPD